VEKFFLPFQNNNQMLKIIRRSSTIASLWVKYNGGQPLEIPTAGCGNVSNLAKAVKKQFSPELDRFSPAQLTLHKSLTDPPLKPGLPLESIPSAGLSAESPLIVKTLGSSAPAQKTILIQEIDAECKPLDSYIEVVVESDAEMKEIYEGRGSALFLITEPKKLVKKFKQLKDGAKYGVYSRYEKSFTG
jgi:hypothetical protein